MRNTWFAVLFLATTGLGAPASAQSLMTSDRADRFAEIAGTFGQAEVDYRDDGSPVVIARMDGVRYGINFYGCKDNGQDCDSLQFRAIWTNSAANLRDINNWNRSYRFAKLWRDENRDLFLEMDINLKGGLSQDAFFESMEWWRLVLIKFQEEF